MKIGFVTEDNGTEPLEDLQIVLYNNCGNPGEWKNILPRA